MSERGSFVTEYVYCQKCFDVLKAAWVDNRFCTGSFCARVVKARSVSFPIIAGKIGGGYSGEEAHLMEYELKALIPQLCCDIRLVVVPDGGDAVVLTVNKIKAAEVEWERLRTIEAEMREARKDPAAEGRLAADPEVAELRRQTAALYDVR